MSRYKILIGGQLYQIAMSDATKYYVQDGTIQPTEDIITYRIEWNAQDPYQGTIYASISNPSQHTQYLMSQGKCYIAVNGKNFSGHYRYRDGDRRVLDSPRCSAIYHKRWSMYALMPSKQPIQVIDYNQIAIPINFIWIQDYVPVNVKGFTHIKKLTETYYHPYIDEYYFDIRLALLSKMKNDSSARIELGWFRPYQTNSNITRVTFSL